jgi:hypothetical protein
MTTEVGARRSAEDIHAVASPTWLSRVRSEIGAEPFLDGDGAVVISVTSGSGPILEGAPPNRTVKLPALGSHQARVTVDVGSSTLQRVVIDAHERLEELTLDASGRIDELIVNAGQEARSLTITGHADAGTLRLRSGWFLLYPTLVRPTTTLDIRDTTVETPSGQGLEPVQLVFGGHVELRGPLTTQSSHITTGAILEELSGTTVRLGLINPHEQAGEPSLELTLRSGSVFVCDYLPPATTVHLEAAALQLQRLQRPTTALLGDSPVSRYWEAPPAMMERLTIIGAGDVQASWDLEAPTFTPKDGELRLFVDPAGNVMNASGRVALGDVAEDRLCQGSTQSPLVITTVRAIQQGAELERVDIYDLSVGDIRRLQPAGRITPWIPGPRAARKREQAMRVGTDSPELQPQRRADFWTQLAAVLSAQQVLGSVQSNVRLASLRARRKALSHGREKLWLSAFSLIGYGERILLPLLLWFSGIVLAGLVYAAVVGIPSGIASPQFVELLGRLALGPLAILRVELHPLNTPGPWDMVIWVAVQLLGTICLGFALVAIRKITRAAH